MKIFIFLFLIFTNYTLSAQVSKDQNVGSIPKPKDLKLGRIYGKVIDAKTGKAIEYAVVQVYWHSKDSLIGGCLVQENGDFNVDRLPTIAQVRVKIKFVGYKDYFQKVTIAPPEKVEQDLGDIKLEIDENTLSEVDVTAEKSAVVLSVDRRTYNVEKDISVIGGTAADVMKNVPGVTVDGDGNAQIRNQAPTLFIDGRPTTLTLQQIPAGQIERVEIITNPSVKFDASAAGGILNIIMKRNSKPGYNGMAMAYVGTGDRYGGVINLGMKEKRWNITTNYSYNQAINDNKGSTDRVQFDTVTSMALGYFNQNNVARMARINQSGKVNIEYMINNRNTITLSEMVVNGKFNNNDKQNYTTQDGANIIYSQGNRLNDQHVQYRNYTTQLLYKKIFPKAGKEFTLDLNNNFSNAASDYLFTTYVPEISISQNDSTEYQKNDGTNKSMQFVLQGDYINPISETSKLETGFKSYYKKSETIAKTFNSVGTEDNYTYDSILSSHYLIDDVINAAYFNYSAKTFWDVNFQGGLRFEQSYYAGNIVDKNQTFSYSYPSSSTILKSLFPAVYFSKKMAKNQELQLNFSRKIQRPNFSQLRPFVSYADKQTIRIGNPQLQPEFKNISELNYMKIFSKGSYLGTAYFRYEEQPITDVAYASPSDPNVIINTTINGKNGFRYGLENILKLTLIKNLDMTLNANAYYMSITGVIGQNQQVITTDGYSYNGKATLSYKFPKSLTLQVNGNYESPKILLLGHTNSIYSMDISLNKVIKKWTFNATLSDVFNTKIIGTHYETAQYTQDFTRRQETRYVKFSVSYLFGKTDTSLFKKGKQNNNSSQDSGLDG